MVVPVIVLENVAAPVHDMVKSVVPPLPAPLLPLPNINSGLPPDKSVSRLKYIPSAELMIALVTPASPNVKVPFAVTLLAKHAVPVPTKLF